MSEATTAARKLFDSLQRWKQLELLVRNGDSESLYLECKSPAEPRLTKDVKAHLAKAIAGFSNTEGGVLIYGAATTKKAHSGLDVVTSIEPLGMIDEFASAISNAYPTLTTPPVFNLVVSVIKKRKSDTSGLVLVYVPKRHGDPIWTLPDETFWFRSGDDFVRAPYEMIKRLFLAELAPDLGISMSIEPIVDAPLRIRLVFSLQNQSYSAARNIQMTLDLDEMKDCVQALNGVNGFRDLSQLNRGRRLFGYSDNQGVIHRGLDVHVGTIDVALNGPKLRLTVKADVFANRMKPRRFAFNFESEALLEEVTLLAGAESAIPI